MGAGGHGGHSLAKDTFFSTDLVHTVRWPGHTWNPGGVQRTGPVIFPRQPILDTNPEGREDLFALRPRVDPVSS